MNDYTSTIITSDIQAAGDGSLEIKSNESLQRVIQAAQSGGSEANLVSDPYSQSDWVFICINAILDACNSIPMMVSTANDEVVEAGPVIDLLYRDKMKWVQKLEEMAGYLALFRCYYLVYTDMVGMRPKSFIVASPLHLRPEFVGNEIGYWVLTDDYGQQQQYSPEEIHVQCRFNPNMLQPWISVPAVKAGELLISTARQAEQLNEAALRNGGKVGNVVEVPGSMTNDQKLYLRNQFDAYHAGANNAGKTAVLSGGAKISAIAQTMVELDMINLSNFTAKGICALFNVPPECVGLSSEAQYAHGPAQQRLIANTVLPILNTIGMSLTHGPVARLASVSTRHVRSKVVDTKVGLKKMVDLRSYKAAKRDAVNDGNQMYVWFAAEEHPTMQQLMQETAEKVLKFSDSGVPLNQLIDAYDLPFEHVKWGDDAWANGLKVSYKQLMEDEANGGPAEEQLPEGQEPDDEDGEDEGEKLYKHSVAESQRIYSERKEEIEQRKELIKSIADDILGRRKKEEDQQAVRYWNGWVKSWAGLEKAYKNKIRGYMVGQSNSVIKQVKKLLKDYQYDPKQKCLTKDVADDVVMRIVFDLKVENDKLRVINRTFFVQGAELGARQIANEIGESEVAKELADKVTGSKYIQSKLVVSNTKIGKINQHTKKVIEKTLTDSIRAGNSVQQIADKISDKLGDNRKRALSIARTQTSGAVSSGRQQAMKVSGVKEKRWLTSGDTVVRDAHHKANNQIVKVGEAFVVGGEKLMYPGDPSGSAGNVIHCRCVAVPHVNRQGKMISIKQLADSMERKAA